MHPDTPEEGLSLDDLFRRKGIPANVDQMMAQLKKTAAGLGLKLGNRKMTYNSRLAQEVGLWAQTENRGHQFHMQAFEAYFVHGLNIAQKNVLMDLIVKSGLDTKEGESIIDNRSFSDAVDADWQLSRNSGITAVPTFKMGLDKLVGAQPYEVLDRMIEKYSK